MPIFTLTNKGNVIECKANCNCNHEHFYGTYEKALKYFNISAEEQKDIKSYGNLLNVIVWHQTSGITAPKLSNELYDLLIELMGTHKYWESKDNREEKALHLLDEAEKLGITGDNFDLKIIASLKKKNTVVANKRIYMYNKWKEFL